MFRRAAMTTVALTAATLGGGAAHACGNGDVTVSFSSVSAPSPAWNPLPGGAASTATFSVTVTRTAQGSVDSARLILRDANSGSPLRLGSSGPVYTNRTGFVAQHAGRVPSQYGGEYIERHCLCAAK